MRGWLGSIVIVAACGSGSQKPAGGDAATDAAAAIDAPPPGCSDDGECAAADPSRPRCAPSGACVACLEHADCADPALPTCDAETNACRTCATSSDCSTGVCNEEDGSCIAASDIYYVDDDATCATGDGTIEAPYCDVVEAMARFDMEPRNFVHFMEGVYPSLRITSPSPPTFSGAERAELTPSALDGRCASVDVATTGRLRGFHFADCAVAISSSGPARNIYVYQVAIDGGGVAVECGQGYCQISAATVRGADVGMRCVDAATCELVDSTIDGALTFGAVATGGASLAVQRSQIVAAGRKGLVAGGAALDVRDSVIRNAAEVGIECGGGSTCGIRRARVRGCGGAGVALLDPVSWQIENSAVFYNGTTVAPSVSGGVWISAPLGSGRFAHNTVYGNTVGVRCGGAHIERSIVWGNATETDGCTAEWSDIDEDLIGAGNLRQDPLLAGTPPDAMEEHLLVGSPCIDAAVGSMTADDIDGQARDGAPDIGADEVVR